MQVLFLPSLVASPLSFIHFIQAIQIQISTNQIQKLYNGQVPLGMPLIPLNFKPQPARPVFIQLLLHLLHLYLQVHLI